MPTSDKKRKTPPTRGKSFKTPSKGDAPKDHLADPNCQSLEPRLGIGDPPELPDAPVKVAKGIPVKELKGMFGGGIKHASLEEMDAAIKKCALSDWRAVSTKEDGNGET